MKSRRTLVLKKARNNNNNNNEWKLIFIVVQLIVYALHPEVMGGRLYNSRPLGQIKYPQLFDLFTTSKL